MLLNYIFCYFFCREVCCWLPRRQLLIDKWVSAVEDNDILYITMVCGVWNFTELYYDYAVYYYDYYD